MSAYDPEDCNRLYVGVTELHGSRTHTIDVDPDAMQIRVTADALSPDWAD